MVTSINPFGNLDEELAKKKKRPTGIFTPTGKEWESPIDIQQQKLAIAQQQGVDLRRAELAGIPGAEEALTPEQIARITAPLEPSPELPPSPVEPIPTTALTPDQQAFQADAIARAQQAAIPKAELAPPEPEITALTTNAELREMVEKKTPLSEWQKQQLAGVIRGSNSPAAKASAQETLRKAGEKRTAGEIAGQPTALQKAIEFRAEVSPTSISSAERKQIAQDEVRELAIKTAERDKLWEREKTDFDETKRQDESGIRKARRKQIELDNVQTEANIASDAAFEADMAELDDVGEETDTEPQVQPTTKTKDEVMSAMDVSDIKQTGFDKTLKLSARYNIPEATRNKLTIGVMASTYTTPVELAKDIDVGVPDQDAYAIKESNVINYREAIHDALEQSIPPDDAVKKILEESDIGPSDKNYAQTALNISYGVLAEYEKEGNVALSETKLAVNQSEAIARNKSLEHLIPTVQRMDTAETMRRMLTSKARKIRNRRLKSEAYAKTGTRTAGRAPLLRAEGMEEAGLLSNLLNMNVKQIENLMLSSLFDRFKNDPQMAPYIADQYNTETRDPAVQRVLDEGLALAGKGLESLRVEEEKEQIKRDMRVKEGLKDGKIVKFDKSKTPTKVVEFPDTPLGIKDADLWDYVGTFGKEALADTAKENMSELLGNRRERENLQRQYDVVIALMDKNLAGRNDGTVINKVFFERNANYLDRIGRIDVAMNKAEDAHTLLMTGRALPEITTEEETAGTISAATDEHTATPTQGIRTPEEKSIQIYEANLQRTDISAEDRAAYENELSRLTAKE